MSLIDEPTVSFDLDREAFRMVRMVPDLSEEAAEALAEAPDRPGAARLRVTCRRSIAEELLAWFTDAATVFPLVREETHKAEVCRRAAGAIQAALQ